MDYTKFLPYFIELDRICEEKNFDKGTIQTLREWFVFILSFYKSSNNILDHFSLEEYIKYNYGKLKQIKDIKVLKLEEILVNPHCLLYKYIGKISSNIDPLTMRFSKQEKNFILDNNGEYYLSALGVCRKGETIELLDGVGTLTFQHELQHINQNYFYSSEFPFANDMLKMLNEGEAEYHYHLLDIDSSFFPIEQDSYYIYYLVYTLLMLAIPEEMRNSWNKIDNMHRNACTESNIFGDITNSEKNRNKFSHIFALATLIVASCNAANTKEIFNTSAETSVKRCCKRVKYLEQIISSRLELDRKQNLERLKYHIELLSEITRTLQNHDLLLETYKEGISYEKELIANETKENQEELLEKLQLFTLENFESQLKEEKKEIEESFRKLQNKKEKSPQEILGEEDYKQYQYYQFGMQLGQKIKILLSQELEFNELFKQYLEQIESYLIESKHSRLDEKLSFIDKIRMNCLINSKKI